MVVGQSAESAKVALRSVPLNPDFVYVPAKPRSRPGQVVKQDPRGGYLSANGTVRLFVTLAQDGLVPNLVGSSLPDARQLTKKLRLAVRVRYPPGGPSGTVLKQSLSPASPCARACRSRCSSATAQPIRAFFFFRAQPIRASLDVAPGLLDGTADPDPGRPLDDHGEIGARSSNGGRERSAPSSLSGQAERLGQPPGTGAEEAFVRYATALPHAL